MPTWRPNMLNKLRIIIKISVFIYLQHFLAEGLIEYDIIKFICNKFI